MKNNFIICFIILFTTFFLYSATNKYPVVKPDGTIDPIGLQLSILDMYNFFQPRQFKKFNVPPAINQIGEAEIVLYHMPGTNISILYTVLENTTYYVTLSEVTSSYGFYHMRNLVPDGDDFNIANSTLTSTIQTYDFSSFLPIGTKSVDLLIALRSSIPDDRIYYSTTTAVNGGIYGTINTQVANQVIYYNLIVPLSTERTLCYKANSTLTLFNTKVKGWFK